MDGYFLESSPSWSTLLGYSEEEIKRTPFMNWIHPDDVAPTVAVFEAQKRGREIFQFENRYYAKDGTLKHLLWRGSVETGGILYGVARDITEQKLAEAESKIRNRNLDEQVAELKRVNAEVSLSNEMADLLQSCLNLQEATEVFSDYSTRLFPETSGYLGVLTPSRTAIEILLSWGSPQKETLFRPDDCWALRRGQIHIVASDGKGIHCNHLKDGTPSLCAPMMASGEGLGILCVQTLRARDIIGLATSVSGRVAAALANFRLRDTLKGQSTKDALTGLFNCRMLEESLAWEFLRSERHQRPLSIIALDIDHFKAVNDTYGHDAGNTALRAVADAMKASIRKEDILCRSGGEEFTVLLAETSLASAKIVADKVLNAVRALQIVDNGKLLPRVTVSAGISTSPEHASSAAQLLRVADAALYAAKHGGRDKACAAVGDKIDAPP